MPVIIIVCKASNVFRLVFSMFIFRPAHCWKALSSVIKDFKFISDIICKQNYFNFFLIYSNTLYIFIISDFICKSFNCYKKKLGWEETTIHYILMSFTVQIPMVCLILHISIHNLQTWHITGPLSPNTLQDPIPWHTIQIPYLMTHHKSLIHWNTTGSLFLYTLDVPYPIFSDILQVPYLLTYYREILQVPYLLTYYRFPIPWHTTCSLSPDILQDSYLLTYYRFPISWNTAGSLSTDILQIPYLLTYYRFPISWHTTGSLSPDTR